MASVVDIGTPGAPLATPPLTEWQAAVRDALNGSDVPVDDRIATATAPAGMYCVCALDETPPAGPWTDLPITSVSSSWGAPFAVLSGGLLTMVAAGRYRMTLYASSNVSGDGMAFNLVWNFDLAVGHVIKVQFIRNTAGLHRFQINTTAAQVMTSHNMPSNWTVFTTISASLIVEKIG